MTQAYPAGEISQIVQGVFLTMMDLKVADGGPAWRASQDSVTALVHLAGVRSGTLLMACGQQLACAWAGRFLGREAPAQFNEDVRDVVSELANMVGGNLKAVIAPRAQLSMPMVIDGERYHLRIGATSAVEWSSFLTDGGPFWVTWLEAKSEEDDH